MVDRWRYTFKNKESGTHYNVDARGIDAAKKELRDPSKWKLVEREKFVGGKLKHHR